MTSIEKLREIIDKIPAIKWASYPAIKNAVDHNCWRRIYPNLNDSDHLAFVTRSKGDKGVFEVFINDLVPSEIKSSLELHEFGHIVYTHMSLRKEQEKIGIGKIKTFWPQIKRYFDIEDPTDAVFKKIYNSLLNIAMDFEVNSKAFSEPEYPWALLYGNIAYAYVVLSTEPEGSEKITSVSEWIDKIYDISDNIDFTSDNYPKPVVPFCWPQDSGFPIRLSFTQYLDLMLLEHEKFFKYMNDMTGGDTGDNSDGSEEDNESDGGEGKSIRPLTEEDLDEINKMLQDSDEEASEAALEEAEEEEAAEQEAQEKAILRKIKNENTDFEVLDDKKLEEFLVKNCFNKTMKDTKVNYLENYNRQKFGSDVFIAKFKEEELWHPGNIYLLVDCSGSISDVIINRVVTVTKKVASKCGKKSRIIWWDECCCGDSLLSKDTGPSGYGGFTHINTGIKYIRESYKLRDNDKIIIISDYLDGGLNKWLKELEQIKVDVIGVCWSETAGKSESGRSLLKNILRGYISSNVVDQVLKRIPTKFIRV